MKVSNLYSKARIEKSHIHFPSNFTFSNISERISFFKWHLFSSKINFFLINGSPKMRILYQYTYKLKYCKPKLGNAIKLKESFDKVRRKREEQLY